MKDRWDIPDEDLDGLFRDASEKLKPPYDPEAWRRMQAKLDEASLPNKAPKDNKLLTRSLLAVLLLLLFSVSYLVYDIVNQPVSVESGSADESQLHPKTSVVPNKLNDKNSADSEPFESLEVKKEKGNSNEPTGANKSGQNAFRNQPEHAESKSLAKPSAPNVSPKSISKSDKSEREDSQFESLKNSSFLKENKLQKVNEEAVETQVSVNANKNGQHKNPITNKTVILFNKQSGQVVKRNLSSKPLLPITEIESEQVGNREQLNTLNKNQDKGKVQRFDSQLDKDLYLTKESPLDVNQERWMFTNLKQLNSKLVKTSVAFNIPSITTVARQAAELPVKPVVITRPKFGVRLMMAPDINTVGSSNPFALGDSYGVLFEYQFINRLRVQVGAVRTVKKYVSGPGDYYNPTGFWTYGVKPATIEADCKILDLPLNIRWDAIRRPKYDLFLGAGLSSYLMLNERYNYKYAPPYNTNTHLRQNWEKSRGSDHFFSTLNLSVGYERQLQKGFTVQIEPYLKLPIKGVGFAAVDIYSTGLLISGKYQFGWKTR